MGCNPDEPADAVTSADIIGSVNLYDEGTNQLANDSVLVTIEGSNPLKSTITAADGSFVLSGISFGTYTISFARSGFGTYKRVGVLHSNTGGSTTINPSPSIGQVSSTTITGVVSNFSDKSALLAIETSPTPTSEVPRYIRVFFSKNANVSFYNYSKYTDVYKHPSNPANLELGIKALNNMGFNTGDTVFARVYGDSFWSNDYDNIATGKREFPNLNSTTVGAVYFVVP